MTSPWRATHSDLYLSGLTPAACRPDALALGGVNLTTGVFHADGHGFSGGERVRFDIGDPSPLRALPTGITADTWYAVANTAGDPDYFALSPLLIPSDAGAGPIFVTENYVAKIDEQMAAWTSVLIAKAIAYKPPWLVPPTWAPMMVAKLAAPTVAAVLRVPVARYPVTMIETGYQWAMAELKFLESGGIYNDGTGPVDSADKSGASDTLRARGRRPVGWGCRGTL